MSLIRLISFLGLIGVAISCSSSDSEAPVAKMGLGFSASELDSDIRPQDDFWSYVNGKWIASTEIPGDRSSYSTFHIINDKTEEQTRLLVEQATAAPEASASERIIGNLYGSFMDEVQIEELGITPLQGLFAEVDLIQNHNQLMHTLGRLAGLGVGTPIQFFTDGDAFDATRSLIYLWQGGLGLPDRSYYLEDNAKLEEARAAYLAHIAAMFDLVGWAKGSEAAQNIFQLETGLAQLQWTRLQNRDRQKIYSNQLSFTAADDATPSLDMGVWFDGYGAPHPGTMVIGQDSYFAALGALLAATDLEVWRTYLRFRVLKSFAAYLPQDIVALNFEFQGKTLRGQTEQAERWRRGVRFVNQNTGELLGQLYVAEHFPDDAKAEIGSLVENLRGAFASSIKALPWMADETKQQALTKLSKFLPKLGYPDEWRDFSSLETNRNTLVANVINAREFARDYELALLEQPVDKHLWNIYPQMVNAFYRPTQNSITFPAGILQHPMFVSGRDPAMNYGAIGSVIGHEFSHGFDDQGRKFDGDGMLRNWWTDADAEQYGVRAAALTEQFSAYQPLPDTSIDGELTLGENIGDLAGVTMAFKAFELSGHADGPTIDGFTPRQRFFISYAIAWRNKIRPQYLRELLLRDTHSPAQYRVMGILPNMPEFHIAFEVQVGDEMYRGPDERVRIW